MKSATRRFSTFPAIPIVFPNKFEHEKALHPHGTKGLLTRYHPNYGPSSVACRGITAPAGLLTVVSAYSYRRIFRRVFLRSFHLYFALCKASTCLLFPVTAFSTICIIIPEQTTCCQEKAAFGDHACSPLTVHRQHHYTKVQSR